MNRKLHTQAARLHTHRVLFTGSDDVELAVRALLGQSIQTIMDATGLRIAQVVYRLRKAGISVKTYRRLETTLSQRMFQIGRAPANQIVKTEIAPRWSRYSQK